jgi:hypothetical protein
MKIKNKHISEFISRPYLSIEYVCNQVSEGAKKVNKQTKIAFETDLFSQ